MKKRNYKLGIATLIALLLAFTSYTSVSRNTQDKLLSKSTPQTNTHKTGGKVTKSESEWKAELTKEQYHILRQKGTERAFTGKYWNNHDTGIYHCAACHAPLFHSNTKFESGTGWPSFYDILQQGNVALKEDNSLLMTRTEVVCSRCDSHLGHVFEDGPKPTGLRYCINSAALDFLEEQ